MGASGYNVCKGDEYMITALRKQRFRRRIEIERQVLTHVNGSLLLSQPLTGITEVAIHLWRNSLSQRIREVDAERLSKIIIEIAKRSSFDADCSRDVFEEDELIHISSVDSLVTQFEKTVREVTESYANKDRPCA